MGIKLDATQMQTLSKSFLSKAENISDLLDSLEIDVNALVDCWEGAGCTEFHDDFIKVKDSVNQMIDIMNNRSSVLSSQATATEDFSTAMANAWK